MGGGRCSFNGWEGSTFYLPLHSPKLGGEELKFMLCWMGRLFGFCSLILPKLTPLALFLSCFF